MRTRADLEGAFALLERQADTYATAVAETARTGDPATGRLLPLAPRPRARRGRFYRATLVLSVAAVTAAIAVVADQLIGPSGPSTHPTPVAASNPSASGATTAAPDPAIRPRDVPRALPFSVRAASELQVLGAYTIGSSGLGATLASRADWYDLSIDGPGGGKLLVFAGMHRIDVNGHRGYFSDGTTGIEFGTPSPDDPPPGSGSPAVIWQNAPNSWATLSRQGGSAGETELLDVARSLDFSGTTPIRSAISLAHVPAGTHLLDWGSTYHNVRGQKPPYDLGAPSWGSWMQYGPGNPGNYVEIVATSGADPNAALLNADTGQSVTVAGLAAYWSGAKHQLTVDLGDGAHLDIREVVATQGTPMTMTLAQLSEIAADVTLTPHPDEPDTWFDAATALP